MKRLFGRYCPRGLVTAILSVHLLLLFGCGAFVSHYDPMFYDHLVRLEEFHLDFIDEFTFEQGKEWSDEDLQSWCAEGDTLFTKALNYELSKEKSDKNRENDINNLHGKFRDDCDFLKKRAQDGNYFFAQTLARENRDEVIALYKQAKDGEESRPGGPQS
jgi:hypothetical protein